MGGTAEEWGEPQLTSAYLPPTPFFHLGPKYTVPWRDLVVLQRG